jgi:hypothetical protein
VTDETYGLFGWVVRDNPGTFLYQSGKQYLGQSRVTSEEETDNDSSKGEASLSFRGNFVLGLLDYRFGEVGQ